MVNCTHFFSSGALIGFFMKADPRHPLAGMLVACPDCDLLQRIPPLPPRGKAFCVRCKRTLAVDKSQHFERNLALSIAALIFFLIANWEPLMMLSAYGRETETTILGSVIEMWKRGYEVTAVLVGFCSVLAPVLYISFMIVINFMVISPPAPWWVGVLLHWSERHHIWVMLEIMMMGILISLIKLSDIATMIPGIGMYAMGVLIGLLAYIRMSFDPAIIWDRLQWVVDVQTGSRSPKLFPPREAET